MNLSNNAFSEGQSIARPPMFNGTDYAYWKARMKIYLSSVDYDVWDIIETGYRSPTVIVNGVEIPNQKIGGMLMIKNYFQLMPKR